jgi:hypothetical protein
MILTYSDAPGDRIQIPKHPGALSTCIFDNHAGKSRRHVESPLFSDIHGLPSRNYARKEAQIDQNGTKQLTPFPGPCSED